MDGISHADSRAFVDALLGMRGKSGETGRVEGVVTKVDTGGTVWVRVRNSTVETPCIRTVASSKPGDRVQVEIGDGKGTVVGNLSSPPTDDSTAQEALRAGSSASQTAALARTMAESAIGDAPGRQGRRDHLRPRTRPTHRRARHRRHRPRRARHRAPRTRRATRRARRRVPPARHRARNQQQAMRQVPCRPHCRRSPSSAPSRT